MALTVETGDGIPGAESYVSVVDADAYWANLPHDALSATWTAASTSNKEGSLREASAYLDAIYGQRYRGYRSGYIQGLQWPRTDTMDEEGYPLPNLPRELKDATCALAVRALSARLASDETNEGSIKSVKEKVGPIEVATEYHNGTQLQQKYGFVEGMIGPLLKVDLHWSWK